MAAFTMQEGGFSVVDYVVFGVLCLASCTGGMWYSAIGSRHNSIKDVKDYLLGGKTMSTFPVAMSLIARYVLFCCFSIFFFTKNVFGSRLSILPLPKNWVFYHQYPL